MTTALTIAMAALAFAVYRLLKACRQLRELIELKDIQNQSRNDYFVSRLYKLERTLK